jgi:hypothetical protein
MTESQLRVKAMRAVKKAGGKVTITYGPFGDRGDTYYYEVELATWFGSEFAYSLRKTYREALLFIIQEVSR